MKIYTNCVKTYLLKGPKLRQWLWFIGLWCVGFAVVFVATYPIKILMKLL